MAKKLNEGRKPGSGRKPGKAKTLAEGRKVGSGRKKGSVSKKLVEGRKAGSGRKTGSTKNDDHVLKENTNQSTTSIIISDQLKETKQQQTNQEQNLKLNLAIIKNSQFNQGLNAGGVRYLEQNRLLHNDSEPSMRFYTPRTGSPRIWGN